MGCERYSTSDPASNLRIGVLKMEDRREMIFIIRPYADDKCNQFSQNNFKLISYLVFFWRILAKKMNLNVNIVNVFTLI